MAKRPTLETMTFTTRPRGMIGRIMAYAGNAEGLQKLAATMDRFELDRTELSELLGVETESIDNAGEAGSAAVQRRLAEMIGILDSVHDWAGGDIAALHWYRTVPIPALGDKPAAELVRNGNANAVRTYIDHIALGGFA